MGLFSKRDRLPRIAYREQRNGVKHYYVESWKCYESGCYYLQDSAETTSYEKAQKMLKEITDKEIVKYGVISQGNNDEN